MIQQATGTVHDKVMQESTIENLIDTFGKPSNIPKTTVKEISKIPLRLRGGMRPENLYYHLLYPRRHYSLQYLLKFTEI